AESAKLVEAPCFDHLTIIFITSSAKTAMLPIKYNLVNAFEGKGLKVYLTVESNQRPQWESHF
ncbi:MAG: hypothetical protein WAM26_05670, partial [Nitrososphaeraceae archaeon]